MSRLLIGDCRESMRKLIAEGVKVQTVVTSPPYWGLRDYGVDGQLGLEPSPQAYVANMVEVFRLVRELLADDGTLWLNLGDSYSSGGRTTQVAPTLRTNGHDEASGKQAYLNNFAVRPGAVAGIKAKDLIGIPWRVAFALQADGWWLRQDIIWHKPNPMPESIRDRCTKAHEYLFLMAKSERYLCDMDAIREDGSENSHGGGQRTDDRYHVQVHGPGAHKGLANARPAGKVKVPGGWDRGEGAHGTIHREGRTSAEYQNAELKGGRNKRSVWTISTSPYPEAHFATYPPALIEPCILAGSRPGDIVFDPFFGSDTTGEVAQRLGRAWIGCELNPEYGKLAERRTSGTIGLQLVNA